MNSSLSVPTIYSINLGKLENGKMKTLGLLLAQICLASVIV